MNNIFFIKDHEFIHKELRFNTRLNDILESLLIFCPKEYLFNKGLRGRWIGNRNCDGCEEIIENRRY